MTLVTPQPARRAHGEAPVDRGRARHQARTLPEHSGGPRRGRAGDHGQHRGRNGNEEVAHKNPELILRETISPATGLQPYHARKLAFGLGLTGDAAAATGPFLQGLYRTFLETDASLAEINPLIVTGDGKLVALDAKMAFDDNALFRHKDLIELRDSNEEDPLEVEASNFKLNYIKLDGNVGCMVNGAGLAMGTMDIIKLSGGSPANFLDVGGGASADR